jgi:uncharacterized protein
MPHPEIILLFFIVSLVYASVGFGGGSSYLAILALYELPFKEMRLIALTCNIIVVTAGSIAFMRHKQVNWKKIVPLIILSIPMAFIGASLKISADVFFILLGISLLIAGVLLWIRTSVNNESSLNNENLKNISIGAGIGFLSGMVGIGGGIFLSPLLNIMKWDTPKKIAAAASVFILVNSLAGIAGQFSNHGPINGTRILLLGIAVLAGGQIGSHLGIVKFNLVIVKRITAVLVFAAGFEVLFKHLWNKL